MNAWSKACEEQTGSSNVYKTDAGIVFMWETSRREYDDGAITGSVFRLQGWTPEGDKCSAFKAFKAGTFKINGDGTIGRAPVWLKERSK